MPPGPDPERRSRIRAIVLIILLVTMGSFGISGGIGGLAADRTPEVPASLEPDTQAALEAGRAAGEAVFRAPLRRPLAAANIAVSALLLIAAWKVATGRPTLRWWVTQGALANAVWTGLETGMYAFALMHHRGEILPLLEQDVAERAAAAPGAPDQLLSAQVAFGTYFVTFALYGLFRIGLYGVMVWLARKLKTRRDA